MSITPITPTFNPKHDQRRRLSYGSIKQKVDELDRKEREQDSVAISEEAKYGE